MGKYFGPARLAVQIDPERIAVAESRTEDEWRSYLVVNNLLLEYDDAAEIVADLDKAGKNELLLSLSKNEGFTIPGLDRRELERRKESDLILAEVCSLSVGFGILSGVLHKMQAQIDLIRKKEDRMFLKTLE